MSSTNRWIWLNLSFLIPFALVLLSACLSPYHYQALTFFRSTVYQLTVPLLVLSHALPLATIILPARVRDRWSAWGIVWFSFLGLSIGTFAFLSSKSRDFEDAFFLLGYFMLAWSAAVPFLICLAILRLIAFRRRANLQRWALVLLWMAIFCVSAWFWIGVGMTSYKTVSQVNIKDHQIYLIDYASFGGGNYIIYHCNSFGFFCDSFDLYNSHTIGSFNYQRDSATDKIYVREGNNTIPLLN